jgi:hypothetical protein
MHKKMFRITIDSLLLVLLLAILVYPATTFGWLRVNEPAPKQDLNVLPASTARPDLTKFEKEQYRKALQDIEGLIESSESTKQIPNQ